MGNQDKKDSTRANYCALIADVGVDSAIKLSGIFVNLLKQINIAIDDPSKILIGFTFMNWGIANGIWTNLENARLRRDLMGTSQRALTHRVATKLMEGERPEDIALYAVQIDDKFQRYFQIYKERTKEIDREGYSVDAYDAAALVALEWIRENTGLELSDMHKICPTFLRQSKDLDEMTSVAMQLIQADETRRGKGILGRFFRKVDFPHV